MQFYPGDWMKDPCLRCCSIAARGLWIDMLCLMWEANPRGQLKEITTEQLSRAVGGELADVDAAFQELSAARVFSQRKSGAVYSRRMIRDEKTRSKWRKKKQLQRSVVPGSVPGLSPPSSSSSSTSVKDPLPPTETSPEAGAGDRFLAAPLVAEVWRQLPNRFCQGRVKVIDALATAVLGHGVDPRHVLDRLLDYTRSAQGKGEYFMTPVTFIRDGHYDDDDAAWGKRAATRQESPPTTGALDRLRKEREAWQAEQAASQEPAP